tara:strand:+ start:1337 stop:1723 length:387 start_codon:yes stop_codon:yes gene_type:complete
MANHAATAGLVKIGGTTVGELRSYNLGQTTGTVEDTVLSDTAKTYKAGQTSFSGSCEMFWDEADAGQNAVTNGATVVLTLYPEGDTSGDTYATGTVIVTEIGVSAAVDGMVEQSFSFTGSGSVVWATV